MGRWLWSEERDRYAPLSGGIKVFFFFGWFKKFFTFDFGSRRCSLDAHAAGHAGRLHGLQLRDRRPGTKTAVRGYRIRDATFDHRQTAEGDQSIHARDGGVDEAHGH